MNVLLISSVTRRRAESCAQKRRAGLRRDVKKRRTGLRRPFEYDSPKDSVMIAYFFFDAFFAPPAAFFAGAFFLAAIRYHRLSCRTGPPGRASGHNLPNRFG